MTHPPRKSSTSTMSARNASPRRNLLRLRSPYLPTSKMIPPTSWLNQRSDNNQPPSNITGGTRLGSRARKGYTRIRLSRTGGSISWLPLSTTSFWKEGGGPSGYPCRIGAQVPPSAKCRSGHGQSHWTGSNLEMGRERIWGRNLRRRFGVASCGPNRMGNQASKRIR